MYKLHVLTHMFNDNGLMQYKNITLILKPKLVSTFYLNKFYQLSILRKPNPETGDTKRFATC